MQKYKDTDKIIATYYQVVDASRRLVNIDGIVNPLKIDNRQQCSVTDDQGQTPHCAAYSICNICEALIWKKTGKLINLNADQVYAKAKELDKMPDMDGTYLECAIKAAFALGGFGDISLKIGALYNDKTDATIEMVKFLLHKYDFLHVCMMITSSWYDVNNENPYVADYGQNLGAHAVLACGYDQSGLYIQNSWGKSFGAKGFAIIPWNVFKKQFNSALYLQGEFGDI